MAITLLERKLANIVSGTLKKIDEGFKLVKVPAAEQKLRISICEACPSKEFDARPGERRCNACGGCPMDFKTSLKYDPIKGIVKRTEITCPKGHW